MAAPTLSTKQKKKSLRDTKEKKQSMKSIWCSPYDIDWPKVEPDDAKLILTRMASTFETLDLTKEKVPWVRGKRQTGEKNDGKTKATKEWTEAQKAARSQMVFGINAVTRHLEQDKLQLVLVDRSATPPMLCQHLIPLSATRRCPALGLPDLAQHVASHLSLTSLVAMGFKKSCGTVNPLDDLIKFIIPQVPEIELPWLPKDDTEEGPVQSDSEEEKSSVDQALEVNPSVERQPIKQQVTKRPSQSQKPSQMGPPVQVPLEAFPYRHLYVMKSEASPESERSDFGSGFIEFSRDEDEEDTIYISKTPVKSKRRKPRNKTNKGSDRKRKVGDTVMDPSCKKRKKDGKEKRDVQKQLRYHTAKLGLVKANPDRNEGKKKKGKGR